jgi:hypothetical protein
MIRALETRYKGYRFRSRLEARWAVFFDALGLDWQYEPEGYDLSGVEVDRCRPVELTGRDAFYLPDFLLFSPYSWVEVKPTEPTEVETERAFRLAKATDRPVVIVCGPPWCDEGTSGYNGGQSGYMIAENFWDNCYMLTLCGKCGCAGWCFERRYDRLPCFCEGTEKYLGGEAQVRSAYLAARGARFEHGETGAMGPGVPS